MINRIFEEMTPHIIGGKKLYDEEDIKKAVAKVIIQVADPANSHSLAFQEALKEVQQYSEATC